MKTTKMLTSLLVFALVCATYAKPAIAANSLDAADGDPPDAVYVDNAGRVGIGTTTPSERLSVEGPIRASVSSRIQNLLQWGGNAVCGEYWAYRLGEPGGPLYITLAQSSGYLAGASMGAIIDPLGVFGVYGEVTDGRFGRGVYGKATTTGGIGVYGEATGAGGVGIYGKGDPNGYAAQFDGTTTTKVLEITGGGDLSEQFEIHGISADVQPSAGMVVRIDSENLGDLVVSNKAYDRRVAGVISGAGGVKPGMLMRQKGSEADGTDPVALTGRVYCWAEASNGAIQPGDLLTTSDVAGHAMKVTDYTRAQGAILGKAMSRLRSDRGLILVLITLQ